MALSLLSNHQVSKRKHACSAVPDSATPWTVAHQTPPSVGLFRQECWSGLPFPSPGDLPNPEITPVSPVCLALAGGFLTAAPPLSKASSKQPVIWWKSFHEIPLSFYKSLNLRDFHGHPLVKTLCSQFQGAQFRSMVRPHLAAKKWKTNKELKLWI